MMAEKFFTVKLNLTAESKEQVDQWLEHMPAAMGEAVYHEEIIDDDTPRFEVRIRYDADWHGQGEHFVMENHWSNEDKWHLDTAFPLIDYKEEKGALLHYTALTKVREIMELGIPFRFKGGVWYSKG